MQKGRLIIVAAPSGAGKTSLTRALIERLSAHGIQAAFSVSYTTRPARPGEQDGVDYHFVSEAQFVAMIEEDAFLEHAQVFGRRYGTGADATREALAMGQILFLDIDWQGMRQVKAKMPEAVAVFIRPPDMASLRQRLEGRGQDSPEAIARRMQQAEAEMSHADEFDYVIVNDEFETALEELADVVLGLPSD